MFTSKAAKTLQRIFKFFELTKVPRENMYDPKYRETKHCIRFWKAKIIAPITIESVDMDIDILKDGIELTITYSRLLIIQ